MTWLTHICCAKSERQWDKVSWTMRVVRSDEHKGRKRRDYLLARLEHVDVETAVHGSKVETLRQECVTMKRLQSPVIVERYDDTSQSLHNDNKLG